MDYIKGRIEFLEGKMKQSEAERDERVKELKTIDTRLEVINGKLYELKRIAEELSKPAVM